MATAFPARAAAEGRAAASRARGTHQHVYACRFCWESVRVTDAFRLPPTCPGCGVSTWEPDGRCGAWLHCEGLHRDGARDLAHCQACGYSIWALVEPMPVAA